MRACVGARLSLCGPLSSNDTALCLFSNPGFDSDFTVLHSILCLIALFVGFHILAFFALRRIVVLKESKR